MVQAFLTEVQVGVSGASGGSILQREEGSCNGPMQVEAGIEDGHRAFICLDMRWYVRRRPGEGHHSVIYWQAVEGGTIAGRKGFQSLQCAFFLEDLRKNWQCVRRGEAAGAAAGQQFVRVRVGRAVGAEKKARFTAGRGGAQSEAVGFALGHG